MVWGGLRWRLAVFVGKTARGSESLRVGWAAIVGCGGCLKSKAGPPAGLYSEGAGLASGGRAAVRDWSACFALWAALRWSAAVVACGRRGSVPLAASSPEGTSPVWWCKAGSLLLWSGLVRLDTTKPGWLAAPADAEIGRAHV